MPNDTFKIADKHDGPFTSSKLHWSVPLHRLATLSSSVAWMTCSFLSSSEVYHYSLRWHEGEAAYMGQTRDPARSTAVFWNSGFPMQQSCWDTRISHLMMRTAWKWPPRGAQSSRMDRKVPSAGFIVLQSCVCKTTCEHWLRSRMALFC